MAVHGYYVVAGLARHACNRGWRFRTLWDGYGLSEAAWGTMPACMGPNGGINTIVCSYLVGINEGQLLTRADTSSQYKKES